MFNSLGKVAAEFICEDCYRAHFYEQDLFIKSYKHCVLANTITPAASRKMCRCSIVPHFDTSGRSRILFPVDKEEEHLDIDGTGGIQCGILKLGELVALAAKYEVCRLWSIREGTQATVHAAAKRNIKMEKQSTRDI
jgi:hypothetical protein